MVVSLLKAGLIPLQSLVEHAVVPPIAVVLLHPLADLAPHLMEKPILHQLSAGIAPIDRKDVLEVYMAPKDAFELSFQGFRCALVVVQELDLLEDAIGHLQSEWVRLRSQLSLALPAVAVLGRQLRPVTLRACEFSPRLLFN